VSGADEPTKPKRNKAKVDERLSAALRENLRRRKEQERARAGSRPPAAKDEDTKP
jgi:hypothetical protein